MKKKITLVLSLVFTMCMLCACGTDVKDFTYGDYDYDSLLKLNVSSAYTVSYIAHNSDYFESVDFSNLTDDELESLSSYGIEEAQAEAVSTWTEVEDEYGECTTFDNEDLTLDDLNADENFSISKAGNTLTTDMIISYGDRQATFEVVYDAYNDQLTMESISITPIKSMSEKMKNAGLNTVISMGIVFLVLIFISLLISCFKIFPYLEGKKKKKAESSEESATVVTTAEPVAATDDTELIAVIAAAIAASEGTSTSDFVVRSIRRR